MFTFDDFERFIFELFIKQIFFLLHAFFRKLFTYAAFIFNLFRRGTIPDMNILLLYDLQDTANCPISTALVFYLKSFAPQCRTIHSGSFDIVGCMYDFMSSVVAPLNCFVTILLFSSDNSHPFTSFTIESPKIIVTGNFFWRCFQLTGQFLVVLWPNVIHFDCRQNVLFHVMTLWRVNLHWYFECPH